jgi:hypothetical protein
MLKINHGTPKFKTHINKIKPFKRCFEKVRKTGEKEFDLHITDQTLPKKHKDKHKTILRMKFSDFEKLCSEIEKFDITKFRSLFEQNINIGKLNRRNCYLVSLINSEEEKTILLKTSEDERTTNLNSEITYEQLSKFVIYPKDSLRFNNAAFLVYERKKGADRINGFLYRYPHHGENEFFYVSKRSMNKFQKELMKHFYIGLQKINFEMKDELLFHFDNIINGKSYIEYNPVEKTA